MRLKLCLLALLCTGFTSLQATTYKVYFMGGQSNMDGYGYVRELTADQRQPHPTVMIFHGNPKLGKEPDGGIGMWAELRPGHGTGFKTDGTNNFYSLRFGPEMTFGWAMAGLTREPIAIIKYAVGGTGLAEGSGYDNWSPAFEDGKGINQFDHALKALEMALSDTDINNDGQEDTLIPAGIVWMQGEADAHSSEDHAKAYYKNLTEIMYLFRKALQKPDLPVVIGKINRTTLPGYEETMPWLEMVQKSQEVFAERDKCATFIKETENYEFLKDDGWHYDSESYLKMGGAFAMAMVKLNKTCSK